jgi:hypothetical protein
LNAKAAELRKRDPSLTLEQAFTKVYTDKENSELANAERHSNGIYEPRELESLKSITKAARALPEMMSLKPRDLGDYETGRSMTPGLDEGYPSEAEIKRLYDEMTRAGRDGRDFDKAAAAYLSAQARVEAAAREAAGVR